MPAPVNLAGDGTSLSGNERNSMNPNRPGRRSHLAAFLARRRDWGAMRASYWTVMHLLGKLGLHIHYVTVGAGREDLDDPDPPAIPTGCTVRLVHLEDMLPFAGKVADLTRESLEDSFAGNDECGAAFFGDELVSFSFNRRSRTRVTAQLDALIPDGFRYSYKAWTHPEHTRRNLSKATGYVRRFAPKRRFEERVISYTETHNYPSLLHTYRHPNRRQLFLGYVGWFTLFGRQIPFNSRQAKKVGFAFVRKSDPGARQYVR